VHNDVYSLLFPFPTTDAVEARQLNATQEVSHSAIGWKSHGHNFLGLVSCAAGGLPST